MEFPDYLAIFVALVSAVSLIGWMRYIPPSCPKGEISVRLSEGGAACIRRSLP